MVHKFFYQLRVVRTRRDTFASDVSYVSSTIYSTYDEACNAISDWLFDDKSDPIKTDFVTKRTKSGSICAYSFENTLLHFYYQVDIQTLCLFSND